MPLAKKQTQVKTVLPQFMKWLLYFVTIFLIVATLTIMVALIYDKIYDLKFFPGVKVNHISLKKMSHAQAVEFFQNQVDSFLEQGLNYTFDNKEIKILPTLSATSDPDVSHNLINFEIQKTIDEAYLYGRKQGYSTNFLQQMWARIFGHNLPLNFNFEAEEFVALLEKKLEPYSKTKQNAKPEIDDEFNISIRPETTGNTFNYEMIYYQTFNNIAKLSNEPIPLSLITDIPTVTKDDISDQLLNNLKTTIATSSIILTSNNDKWSVPNNIFKDWLIFKNVDEQILLGLDSSTTTAYLKNKIAPNINLPTLEAKFEITNGRVVEFQGSQDGLELDIEKSLTKLETEFLQNHNHLIELVVNKIKAKVTTGSINDLGVTEIIGVGNSNFSGSPNNRRHNIKVGADTLNGILIKPNEEFSLITTLGEIDAQAGYLQELVIKGDKTIAEYGGGLCQIGTTVFRATLNTGLPITLRRNHSYRVSYYEPAGTDATIYNPWPDLKFINDTANHILIQSRIEGDNLYFDFWGTSDGRIVEQTDPVIYNIKNPGPTQYIETTDLEPGQKRCTESAHAGADAYFDYKVTYVSGEVEEERFSSHYIPWPARCLIGIDPETASSTEEIIEE